MSHPSPDAGIPVLTEVLVDPLPPTFTSGAKATAALAASPHAGQSDSSIARDIERFAEMEDELMQRVLQNVLGRLDPMVEERVRNALADVLQTAVDDLAAEIREGLHDALRDVVVDAATEEMKRFRNQK